MDAEARRRNQIRRMILTILSKSYPRPVDHVVLRRLLADFGHPSTEASLNSYIAYLQERGYVRLQDNEEFGIAMSTITADGLDVLDGRRDDPGVK